MGIYVRQRRLGHAGVLQVSYKTHRLGHKLQAGTAKNKSKSNPTVGARPVTLILAHPT